MEKTIHNIADRINNFYNVELSEHGEKLVDRLVIYPGNKVQVVWGDGNVDIGYMFSLPGQFEDEGDVFVHFVTTSNVGGMDDAGPVWIHLTDLLNNEMVVGIENIL